MPTLVPGTNSEAEAHGTLTLDLGPTKLLAVNDPNSGPASDDSADRLKTMAS